ADQDEDHRDDQPDETAPATAATEGEPAAALVLDLTGVDLGVRVQAHACGGTPRFGAVIRSRAPGRIGPMISATGLELRAGARILLSETSLRVQPGDRIGLVGRNGAGKTTTLKVLAGEALPFAGQVERRGPVGYLPQDPRTGDLDITARDRVL